MAHRGLRSERIRIPKGHFQDVRGKFANGKGGKYEEGEREGGEGEVEGRRGGKGRRGRIVVLEGLMLSTSCLHSLLPPPRDPELLSRLRTPSKYPRISNRTKKYQSFISYALAHYQ